MFGPKPHTSHLGAHASVKAFATDYPYPAVPVAHKKGLTHNKLEKL